MRSSSRLLSSGLAALAAILLCATPSSADEPAAPAAPADAPPEPAAPVAPIASAPAITPDTPADAPAIGADTRRGEGIRLGLELGFQRAFSGATDRLNAGSPSLIPLGAELSFRTSPSLLLGFHGYAALASRDDCIAADSCRARGYGFGGHVEHPLGRGRSFVPYIRYAAGYELLYQGGAPLDREGHLYRSAFDFIDLRVGGDFIVAHGSAGKTTRIGAYVGFVGGFLLSQSGVSHVNGSGNQPRDVNRDSGSAHLWFAMGLRGNLDP